MNICHHCGIGFSSFGDYHEHIALNHWTKEHDAAVAGIKTHSTGRPDLAKQAYKGPMDKKDKARIVKQGEERLGKEHFYGTL